MWDTWSDFAVLMPEPAVVERGEVHLMSSGLPIPLFNPVIVTGRCDPVDTIDAIVEHYGERGLPWVLWFREEVAPGLAAAAVDAGLVEHWQPPLMVLDPIPREVPAVGPGFEIVRVDASNVAAMADVLAGGFGMSPEVVNSVFGPDLLGVNDYDIVLGLEGGRPVATAACSFRAGLSGVYSVATLAESRGKGYGAAVTWAAAAIGRDKGATASILQASEAGAPVYTRMGYATPARYRQFEPPAA